MMASKPWQCWLHYSVTRPGLNNTASLHAAENKWCDFLYDRWLLRRKYVGLVLSLQTNRCISLYAVYDINFNPAYLFSHFKVALSALKATKHKRTGKHLSILPDRTCVNINQDFHGEVSSPLSWCFMSHPLLGLFVLCFLVTALTRIPAKLTLQSWSVIKAEFLAHVAHRYVFF